MLIKSLLILTTHSDGQIANCLLNERVKIQINATPIQFNLFPSVLHHLINIIREIEHCPILFWSDLPLLQVCYRHWRNSCGISHLNVFPFDSIESTFSCGTGWDVTTSVWMHAQWSTASIGSIMWSSSKVRCRASQFQQHFHPCLSGVTPWRLH